MSPDQKRAKDLYIKGKKPSEIAEELELSISTVYKWIKDEKLGFEKAKRLANFSVDAMGEMLLEVYKEFIVGLQDNPERLKDPATADSVIKMTKAIKSLEKERKKHNEVCMHRLRLGVRRERGVSRGRHRAGNALERGTGGF